MRLRLLIAAIAAASIAAVAVAHGATGLTIFTIAGGGGQGFAGDGRPATSAGLNGPAGVVAAPDGGIIVADTIDQRIRRIDPSGRILTIAGSGRRGDTGDGGPPLAASLQDPTALALAKDGTLFIADTGNSRIRALRPNGTITSVAGTGTDGFSGDGGRAATAQLSAPEGLAIDQAGNVFVSDTGNNRVRVIRANGTIDTIAGTGQAGFGGDGGSAKSAKLNAPAGLALSGDGSLLIADAGNNRVRRIAPNGVITTVAGNGGGGSGGDGGPATSAQLNLPVDVAAVPSGAFFVAEQGGDRIRMVNDTGTISRLAGTGAPRFGGDGHSPLSAYLNAPHALELMPSNYELLVADTDNNRIRYVGIPGGSSRLAVAAIKPVVGAKLVKRVVRARGRTRRFLAVRNTPFGIELTKPARLTLRIVTKRGHRVATFRVAARSGLTTTRLPARLRSGKHRLKKDHYVVGVTATTGTAAATTNFALIVK